MSFDVVRFISSLPSIDWALRMPGEEYASRIERVRQELARRGLDAAFAFGTEYRPGDSGWLTGYDPHIESTAVIIGAKKAIVLGSPDAKRYAEEMMRVGEFRSLVASGIPDADYPGHAWVTMAEAFEEACGKAATSVGLLTPADVIPVQTRGQIEAPKAVDLSGWMTDARYAKSPRELDMMRVASTITAWGMEAMLRAVRPGVRELEVAACADYVMKAKGADRFGFTTIVQSGKRVTSNIGRATEKIIEAGDMVVLGCSGRYEGLCSASGRTVVAGGANPDQAELMRHAVKAFELGTAKLVCGRPAREADAASREYLKSVGLKQMYNLGHGIGWTEVFEKGIASQHSTYDFPAGIAIQMDVGIFGVPWKSQPAESVGYRVEEPYLIDAAGQTHRLTTLPLSGKL
jgi:Xaa-Pro aminopeptidase